MVVTEIVSPDDRHEALLERLEEFRAWGVPQVWLVDPDLHRVRCRDRQFSRTQAINGKKLKSCIIL